METYTVLHSQSGTEITFDWYRETPPTTEDMRKIFSEALGGAPVSPEKRTPVPREPELIPDPELVKERGVEENKRLMATAEQYGIPLEMAARLAKPETLGQHLAAYSAQPVEAAKLATGAWPFPVGEATKTLGSALQKIREAAAGRKHVPKTPADLAKVAEDLAAAEQEIKTTIPIPKEERFIPGEQPGIYSPKEGRFIWQHKPYGGETIPKPESTLPQGEAGPIPAPKGLPAGPQPPKEIGPGRTIEAGPVPEGFQGWETTHPGEVRPTLATAIQDVSNGQVYSTSTKTPHALLAERINAENGVPWENMKSGFVAPNGKFVSTPGEIAEAKTLLEHYSGEPRTTLRGAKTPEETNRYSLEIRQRMGFGETYPEYPYLPEINVYGPGANPEVLVKTGRVRHQIKYELDDLYDLNKDPDKLWHQATDIAHDNGYPQLKNIWRNIVANLIQQKGYKGYVAGENRYLFGEVSAQVGKTVPGLLPHLASGSIGAGIGGAVDDENRWRGAVLGGAAGLVLSAATVRALLPKGQTLPPGSRLVKGGNVEIPPVKDLPPSLTEPSLRYPPHKAVSTKATEEMIAKGITRDPDKLMSQQIMEEIHANEENFVEILKGYGVTPKQFANFLGIEASSWARKMGLLGNLSRRMKWAGTPEEKEAFKELHKVLGEATSWDQFQYWWRRVDNVRRALLVTQLSTAMRNAETQLGRVGMDVFEQALNSGLQKLWGGLGGTVEGKVGVLDGLEPVLHLFGRNKATVSRLLKALPGGEDRLLGNYMADISTGSRWGSVQRGVDIVNSFNRFQEFTIRRSVFMGKLDQTLSKRGLDLHEIIAKNQTGVITQDDLRYAVNEALDFTFAKQPKWGSVGQKFVSIINAVPGATWFLPFPRFMVNSLKFNFEYSPFGLLKLISSAERQAFKAGDMKTISRAIIGSTMLGAAWQMRNSEYAGEKWNELKLPDGKILDMRPYNPFGAYLFVADVAKKIKDGSFYKMTWNDIAQGILGSNLRAGVGLWAVDKVIGAFSEFATEAKKEQAMDIGKQLIGEVMGGLATPLNMVKEFCYGFDDYAVKERRSEPLLGPLKARIPPILNEVEPEMPPAYRGTREEPVTMKWPAVRQLTGLAFGPPKNPLEKELDRLGFDRREILAPMGDPAYDNLVAQKMGWINSKFVVPLLNDSAYQQLTDAQKGFFLSEALQEARKNARDWAGSEQPEKAIKIKMERSPKREKLVMKELGIIQ